jgi:6-pyruvoyl-tetrahydropterin synthase
MKSQATNQVRCIYHFCASHVVEELEPCARLHGHTYTLSVLYGSFRLNSNGRIITVKESDQCVKPLISKINNYFLVSQQNIIQRNPYVPIAAQCGHASYIGVDNTTLSELTRWIYKEIKERLKIEGVYLLSTELSDMPDRSALYQGLLI